MAGIAYLDASGSEADPRNNTLVAAGFVVPEPTWRTMIPLWDRALQAAHRPIKAYGSADMERLAMTGADGWDSGKVDALRRHLLDVLTGCGFYQRGFACLVHHSDWEAVNRRYQLQEHLGGLYA